MQEQYSQSEVAYISVRAVEKYFFIKLFDLWLEPRKQSLQELWTPLLQNKIIELNVASLTSLQFFIFATQMGK